MMRLFVVMLFLSAYQVKGQDSDCLKEIRTGKFGYEGRYGQDVEIVRTEGEQIELTNTGKSKLLLDISWTSETTYVLTLKQIVNNKGCLKIGETINVTVLECKGKRYRAKYASEKCGKGESTFVKID